MLSSPFMNPFSIYWTTKMMTEDVSVTVKLECTGNPLADFHVGSLADVAVTGDHVGFYNQEDTGAQLAEVIGRDIYYMEAGCGLRRVLSVCLTVKCPFETGSISGRTSWKPAVTVTSRRRTARATGSCGNMPTGHRWSFCSVITMPTSSTVSVCPC